MWGDVWLNNSMAIIKHPTLGDEGWATILHELGHALGLVHPFDNVPLLNASLDTNQYTVMSYDPHPASATVWPVTPMLYDIQALQSLYGANMSTRAGNTVYFGASPGHVYTLADHGSIILTIWDAGGIDAIDAANQTGAVKIDLNAGHYSSIGALTNNVAIAFGAVIENAKGGKGNDILVGNDGANVLTGGGGNDSLNGQGGIDAANYANAAAGVTVSLAITVAQATGGAGSDTLAGLENLIGSAYADTLIGNAAANILLGGGGNDSLDGGGGVDTASYAGAAAGVTLSLAIGTAQATGGAGADTLARFENLLGGAYADTLTGNFAGNTLWGGGGSDRLNGNGGNDVLSGQGGNDTLGGGQGNDQLWGGAGADFFVFSTALNATSNVDVIRDYSVADDTIRVAHAIFTQAGAIGPLDSGAFQRSAAALDTSDRIIYQAASGALFYDADGTGATAQIRFATLTPGLVLTFADFVIV